MQIKLFALLVACWSSSWTRTNADSGCLPKLQPAVTHFDNTYSGLTTISDDNLSVLDHYSDRQLGIFRFSRNIPHEKKRFTLAPLNERASIVSVESLDVPSECAVALTLPDPWNKARVFMTTVHHTDFMKKPFKGFDDHWVSVVVTNSTEGRINFTLCDKLAFITLEPFVGSTTMVPQVDYLGPSLNLSDEWMIQCNGFDPPVSHFLKKIEKFLNRKQRTPRQSIIWNAFWLLGAILVALVVFVLAMKFVLCCKITDKLTGGTVH